MALAQKLVESVLFSIEMFYEIWWALVLGFTISGAIQTFVSEERMSNVLGGRGLRETSLGAGFGFLSSSCSFAAVATARSLYRKGASPEASLAGFQFASTNLVIELGLVIFFLLGWQFVVANFLGGIILILLLALITRYVIPDEWFDTAREHAEASGEGMQMDTLFSLLLRIPKALLSTSGLATPTDDGSSADQNYDDAQRAHAEQPSDDTASEAVTPSGSDDDTTRDEDTQIDADESVDSLRSVIGWKHAFRRTMNDWAMVASDVIIGFLIAGVVATFVPNSFWDQLFTLVPQGTFAWVVLGCFLGVTLAVFTFLCSIGNVPFAVILWNAGIPFGGVISFIFGDLVVPQIDNLYRKYYGLRMAGALFVSIFTVAVVVGVIIYYIWATLGLIPSRGGGGTVPSTYKLVLTVVFTALFLVQVYIVYIEPRRSGGAAPA
jgi:uncharacterized membrane protein YraQ (UPF0718 family)